MGGRCFVVFVTFLKKLEISDYSENISPVARVHVSVSVIPDVFAWQWAVDIDGQMKMFDFLIDIFFSSDLCMKLVKPTLNIIRSFFAQIYWNSYYKKIFLFINILF